MTEDSAAAAVAVAVATATPTVQATSVDSPSEPASTVVEAKEEEDTSGTTSKKRTLEESNEENGTDAVAADVHVDVDEKKDAENEIAATDESKPKPETEPAAKKARVESETAKPSTSIFGSGMTSTTMAGSTGFGFGSQSSISSTKDGSKPLFGSSDGTSSKPLFGSSNGQSSIFGGSTSTGLGFSFGSSSNKSTFSFKDTTSTNSTTGTTTAETPQAPIFTTKASEPISNGEEGEECTYTIRAKLFRLEKDTPPTTPPLETPTEPTKPTGGIQYANSIGDKTTTQQQSKQDATNNSMTSKQPNWKEVGIGPLKILSSTVNGCTTHRVVQRRESTPGGAGTKLILNVVLKDGVQVGKSGEKFVTLGVMEVVLPESINKEEDPGVGEEKDAKKGETSVQAVQYLLKVKTAADADALRSSLEKVVVGIVTTE